MAGREVREYTNLTDPKENKRGKGKERIDDEDITFQRMVAKMQEAAGEHGGYLHGRGALDSDDLLYLKEQMEAEQDAERLLRRTEKRAFAAFKQAACLADSSLAPVPLPLRVEPKPKSGIRQQDLLKNIVEIRPKRHRVSSPPNGTQSTRIISAQAADLKPEPNLEKELSLSRLNKGDGTINSQAVANLKANPNAEKELQMSRLNKGNADAGAKPVNPVRSLLGLAYESSDSEED